MTYATLGKIDSTPDQHLGLAIACKRAVQAIRTKATTPEEYLAERVRELLAGFEQQWVTDEKAARFKLAVDAALESKDASANAAAQALGVDLVVAVPDDVIRGDVADVTASEVKL